MRIAIAVFLFFGFGSPVFADWEWRSQGEDWCLLGSYEKLCLPSRFEVVAIAKNRLRVVDNSTTDLPITLDFLGNTRDSIAGEKFPSELFVLANSEETDTTFLREYHLRSHEIGGHDHWLLILVLNKEMQIELNGAYRRPLQEVAEFMVHQWSGSRAKD